MRKFIKFDYFILLFEFLNSKDLRSLIDKTVVARQSISNRKTLRMTTLSDAESRGAFTAEGELVQEQPPEITIDVARTKDFAIGNISSFKERLILDAIHYDISSKIFKKWNPLFAEEILAALASQDVEKKDEARRLFNLTETYSILEEIFEKAGNIHFQKTKSNDYTINTQFKEKFRRLIREEYNTHTDEEKQEQITYVKQKIIYVKQKIEETKKDYLSLFNSPEFDIEEWIPKLKDLHDLAKVTESLTKHINVLDINDINPELDFREIHSIVMRTYRLEMYKLDKEIGRLNAEIDEINLSCGIKVNKENIKKLAVLEKLEDALNKQNKLSDFFETADTLFQGYPSEERNAEIESTREKHRIIKNSLPGLGNEIKYIKSNRGKYLYVAENIQSIQEELKHLKENPPKNIKTEWNKQQHALHKKIKDLKEYESDLSTSMGGPTYLEYDIWALEKVLYSKWQDIPQEISENTFELPPKDKEKYFTEFANDLTVDQQQISQACPSVEQLELDVLKSLADITLTNDQVDTAVKNAEFIFFENKKVGLLDYLNNSDKAEIIARDRLQVINAKTMEEKIVFHSLFWEAAAKIQISYKTQLESLAPIVQNITDENNQHFKQFRELSEKCNTNTYDKLISTFNYFPLQVEKIGSQWTPNQEFKNKLRDKINELAFTLEFNKNKDNYVKEIKTVIEKRVARINNMETDIGKTNKVKKVQEHLKYLEDSESLFANVKENLPAALPNVPDTINDLKVKCLSKIDNLKQGFFTRTFINVKNWFNSLFTSSHNKAKPVVAAADNTSLLRPSSAASDIFPESSPFEVSSPLLNTQRQIDAVLINKQCNEHPWGHLELASSQDSSSPPSPSVSPDLKPPRPSSSPGEAEVRLAGHPNLVWPQKSAAAPIASQRLNENPILHPETAVEDTSTTFPATPIS